ncbi:Hvo_1808 family surface protein [Halorubrum sp. DTA98]|uniref:Hvo_1808 family surface protein n=1 Tax=Halorubrum sp. DTA98 TaxID=3402163 RepID=UPI003AAAF645
MRRVLVLAVVVTAVALSVGVVAADASIADPAECDADVTTEAVGCWNGVHHGDHPEDDLGIPLDGADDLSDEQLELLISHQMARVEAIRERPFESTVPVEVMTREEFTADRADRESDPEFDRWNDQVWKALFVIGEDDSSGEVINDVFSGAVAGFYSPADGRITIVVDDTESVSISPTTLLHELGHAMQDQYDDLSDPRYSGATQDADLGVNGIVEGEVVYIEEVYAERCEGEWTCLDEPSESGGGDAGTTDPNLGVFFTVFQPYSDGAPYVDELIEADGWEAVDDLMADPPKTTRETIHREPFDPVPIEYTDTAVGGWETYDEQGINGSDTAGEASIFVSMWYQSTTYDAGVMEYDHVFDTVHPYRTYNYAHPATTGWANDELYPYRNDAGAEERDGYVWVTEWETDADAAEFHEAYLRILDAHDADHREDGIYHVADGDFRGAYGIERNDTTVTIAHALEPESVFELRPNIVLDEPEPEVGDVPESPSDVPGEYGDDPWAPSNPSDPNGSTNDPVPGFGVVTALVALLVTLTAAVRRIGS